MSHIQIVIQVIAHIVVLIAMIQIVVLTVVLTVIALIVAHIADNRINLNKDIIKIKKYVITSLFLYKYGFEVL